MAHLEHGQAGTGFPSFHAIGDALGTGSVRVSAAALAAELREIRERLRALTPAMLWLGERTANVLYHEKAAARPLTAYELSQLTPVGDSKDLAEYFASLLDSLDNVCAKPASDGTIEIVDG
ncbi:MAG: hypothetical protein ABI678_19635 [Kofleriaceae bacterium]